MALIKIAIDAAGGDYGYSIVVPAAILAAKMHLDLHVVLVGDESLINKELAKQQTVSCKDRVSVRHASQVVAMDESPTLALRLKKDSSMRIAINLIKEKTVHACVSAGNTGALMATARFVLKTIPGIDRPAIISALPADSKLGHVYMLDLGANIDSDAQILTQFAVMGSVLVTAVENIAAPRIALLNIGEEEIKGNELVKKTASILADLPDINYIGYIEGDKIFTDFADVVVCDGFVGNVALKCLEGEARFIINKIKAAFTSSFMNKLIGFLSFFVLRKIKKQLNAENYNGATLVGLNGIVIKSHGGTSINGFVKAIEKAMLEAKRNVPELIGKKVAQILNVSTT